MVQIVADSITTGGLRLTTVSAVVFTMDYHVVTQPRELIHSMHKAAYGSQLTRGAFHKILLTSGSWASITDYWMAVGGKDVGALGWDVRRALKASKPKVLEHGMWHLPFVDQEDHAACVVQAVNDIPKGMKLTLTQLAANANLLAAKCSAVRCQVLEVPSVFENRLATIREDLATYHLAIEGRVTEQLFTEHQFTPDLIEEGRWLNQHLQAQPAGWVQLRPVLAWDWWRQRDVAPDANGAKCAQG